ncbi:MAG: PAS domain S-box protein [Deferrisomatales bacterium]|nr:PAS domain S-box protein [Deferrisomatales bacterium]
MKKRPEGRRVQVRGKEAAADGAVGVVAPPPGESAVDVTEDRKAEEFLRASEERLRLFIEHAPASLAMLDRDLRYLQVSRRWLGDFGLGERDLTGRSHWEVFPEIPERWQEAYRRGLAGEVVQAQTDRFDRKDGSVQWLRWEVRPWLDAGGAVGGIVIFTEDVTEQQQAQTNQTLLANTLRVLNRGGSLRPILAEVLGQIRVATGFDAAGLRLRQAEDCPYFEQSGFSGEFLREENFLCAKDGGGAIARDAAGRAVLECTCGLVLCGRTDLDRSFFTEGGSFWTNAASELLALPLDADPRTHPRNRCIHAGYESVGLFPVRSGAEILGLLQLNDRRGGRFTPDLIAFYESLAQNIGLALQRVAAREALQASEERLKRAQEIAHLGSWELDLEHDRLTWSDEVYRIFGLEPQELRATYGAFLDGVHPDDRAAVDAAYSSSLRENRDSYEIEHRVVRKGSGEVRFVHEKCRHFRDEAGKIVRSVGMVHDITGHRKAEEALRRSEERFRRLFETMGEGFALHELLRDADGNPADYRFLLVNAAFERQTGLRAADVVGRTAREVLPGIESLWIERFGRVALTGEPAHFESYSEALGRWYEVHAYRTEPERFGVVFLDVTERKRTEEALRRYELLAEQSRDIILFLRGGDWRVLEANAAAVAAYGYTRAELLALSIQDLRAPDARGMAAEQMADASARGALFETVHRRRDATTFPVEVSARGAIINGERCLVSVVRDITERRRAEASLRESESFHRQALESIPGMVFTTRPDGYCDYQSQQWIDFTGVPMKEHLGDGWSRLLHPEDQPRAFAAWRAAVEERAPYDLEYRVRRHDGVYEWFKVRANPIRDEAGQIIRWFGTALNIDELVKTQEALGKAAGEAQAANRAKSDFLARMSHEIRTPMNGVMGMTELALLEGVPAKPAQYLRLAKQSAKNLLDIINDILDLSRIEAGKAELDTAPFHLRRLMEEMVSTLGVGAHEKGLRLSHHVDAGIPDALRGDEGRLRQVLTNLVANAIKFTARGEVEVTVGFAQAEGAGAPTGSRIQCGSARESAGPATVRLCFAVRDTGIGIPAENLGLLFDSFSAATRSTHSRYGGTGLGLSIAKHLVELMGGEIRVESTPGEGSLFVFTAELECCETGDTAGAHEPRRGTPPPVRSLRVLLAEDNVVNRLFVRTLLESRGHSVTEASNGREALEELAQGHVDGVLMDVQMPEIDGLEAARRIRRGEVPGVRKNLPIVALTAHALRGDRERFLGAGMDDYLCKPFDPYALDAILAGWMSGPTVGAGGLASDAPPEQREDLARRLEDWLGRLPLDKAWKLVEVFRKTTSERVTAMRAALARGDGSGLAAAAHTLRGSALLFDAKRVAELCARLEALGESGELEEAADLIEELQGELTGMERFFQGAREASRG